MDSSNGADTDELDVKLRIAADVQLFVEEGSSGTTCRVQPCWCTIPPLPGSMGAIAFSAGSSRFLAIRDRLARELGLAAADLEMMEAARAPARS